MNYAELAQSVVDITDRGENPAAIQLAIAKATLKFHLADFWLRDIVEKLVTVTDISLAPRYEINLTDSLPGFRKISYLNAWDPTPTTGGVLARFTENAPGFVRNVYGNYLPNTFYVAGDQLTLRSFNSLITGAISAYFLIGYWKIPNVQAANYDSWIADMVPFGIIDEACVDIFGSVGDDDEAARRKKMFPENLQILRIQDVEATGR